MKSLPLQNKTRRIGAPENWNHETDGICHTLEVHDRDGWMISAWQPTAEELRLLNEGNPLLLGIAGATHPVVSLWVAQQPEQK